jgi:hypothetical protein
MDGLKMSGFSESDHPRDSDGKFTDKGGRAAAGGQIAASNGYFYKGGQFLPSTDAKPGKWKVGKKWVTTGKELIAPGEFGVQPTPFSRSIFEMVRQITLWDDDRTKLRFREGTRDYQGNPVTENSTFRPGVKGVLGKEEVSYKAMIDAYNSGQRWFDVDPEASTLTKKG